MSAETPASRRAIVVFDGVCVLCSRWVQFILHRDRAGAFAFASMQSRTGARLLAEHGLDPLDPLSLLVVDATGAGHVDSEAILRVARGLGGGWRALVVTRLVPRAWRDAAYRALARRRYRWFGRREQCLMPDADLAERFLP